MNVAFITDICTKWAQGLGQLHVTYCNGSALETHVKKLPAHSFCTDVIATGGMELCHY